MSDRKIVDYEVVQACLTTIDDAVKNLMIKGWQPLGAPFLDDNGNLLQAMVKYEDKQYDIPQFPDDEKFPKPNVTCTVCGNVFKPDAVWWG